MTGTPGADEALLRRAIVHFAQALAVTPADLPARRQPPHYGRRKQAIVTRREVLIDAITAAGDLLAMGAPGGSTTSEDI